MRGAYLVVDKVTGEVAGRFATLASAAESLGRDAGCTRQVNGLKMFDRCRFVIRRESDYDPHESFAGKRRGVPVVAIAGKSVTVYDDAPTAVEALHVSRSTLQKYLSTGEPIDGEVTVRFLPFMGALGNGRRTA